MERQAHGGGAVRRTTWQEQDLIVELVSMTTSDDVIGISGRCGGRLTAHVARAPTANLTFR